MSLLKCDPKEIWTCQLKYPDGHRGLVVWNLDEEVEFKLDGKTFKKASDLYGKTKNITGLKWIKIDYFPRLLD